MLTLKDLPIFVSSPNANQKCSPVLLDPVQFLKKKPFRMLEQNRKQKISLCEVRLSHQTILDQPTASSKMKRRISTAGANKRFPKDFFNMDVDIKNTSKSPKFVFSFTKKELQNSLKNANKLLLQKNSKRKDLPEQKLQNQSQKTPKFKGQEEIDAKNQVNQFLLLQPENKFLKPFLSLDGMRDGEKNQICAKPLSFLKKVKKGPALKRQNRINRTLSQHQYGEGQILDVNKIRCCY